MRPHYSTRVSSQERGSVLVVSLLVVLVCTGFLMALLNLGMLTGRETVSRGERERTFQLAESGLSSSLMLLREGRTGAIAERDLPASFGGGILWVTVTNLTTRLSMVTSSAAFGRERIAVGQLVFHFDPDPLATGVFADRSILVESNCVLDSFDPADGSYADQLAASGENYVGEDILLQSNGDVEVESTSEIHGDVNPGVDGSVVVAGNATVTGRIDPMPLARSLPLLTTPVIASTGNYTTAAVGASIGPGDLAYDTLLIQTNTDLTVVGPARIVLADFNLRSNAALTIDSSGGPVEIFFEGDAVFDSNSVVSTTASSATDTSFIFNGGPSQDVALDSNCQFHGTIYAPEATIELSSNFEIFGAIAAAELVLSSNSRVHFDESLATSAPADRLYFPGRWSPILFPDRDLRVKRFDALRVIGVDADDLPDLTTAIEAAP